MNCCKGLSEESCCGGNCGCSGADEIMRVSIGDKVPDFELPAFHEGKEKKVKLSHYKGKWAILFFYPADFTFVCPTELEDMAEHYDEFKKIGTEILSVSRDTVFVHKAWHDTSDSIRKIKFPMLSDTKGEICSLFGTLCHEDGLSFRGSFIIDPDGVLKAFEVHDNSIGRSARELIRKLKAAQFVREHGGEVCPANWEPGGDTLKPGMDLVGKM